MTLDTLELETDGALIRYRVAGDPEGDPVMLVQGLGLPGAMWLELVEQLEARGFYVIVPDNRGTGGSRHLRRRPFSMRDLGDDLAAVLGQECGPRRALVVGISLGGMIVQHLVLDHPERVKGLVLACTTCGLPENLRGGAFFSPRALRLLLKRCFFPDRVTPEEISRLLAHRNSGAAASEFLGLVMEAFGTHGATAPSIYLGQLLAALRHSTGKRLGQIEVPTIVVTGDSDFLIPPKNAEILSSRIPNAKTIVVPNAGHIFPYEHKAILSQVIEELRVMAQAAAAAVP